MVFGLFEGNKLDIVLDKPAYSLGEPVTGKVILTLKQPKKAKGLRVSVYLEYTTERQVVRSRGNPPRQVTEMEYDTQRMGEQSIMLDTAEEYPAGVKEYQFSIPTMKGNYAPGGFAQINGWFINSSLDIPMSADVSKKLKLNLM